MQKIFSLILIYFLMLPAQAQDLLLEAGRIALVDFGSIITSDIELSKEGLVNAYKVSGLDDEDQCSIVAVQGLEDQGELDLLLNTNSGFKQLRIVLNSKVTEDLRLSDKNSRIKIDKKLHQLNPERTATVILPKYANKRILVSEPGLLNAKQILDYYDKNFMRSFSVFSSSEEGIADLILPSKAGVYKLSFQIKRNTENENLINLH